MPALTDVLLDPITLSMLAIYGVVLAWEALLPARRLPHAPFWHLRGVAAFAVYFLISTYLPYLWAGPLEALRIADASALGTLGGAAIAVLLYELGLYAWHRAMHRSSILWRIFHQMHHSAERIDAFGAFWMSPLDMAAFTLLFSIALALFGFTPGAIAGAVLATTFLSIFQHANVKTPVWLGYLVQRPESHAHHHARGVHAGNYSDLPIFDLIFGTFVNPKGYPAEAGFYDGASMRVVEMLSFRDVSTPTDEHDRVTQI